MCLLLTIASVDLFHGDKVRPEEKHADASSSEAKSEASVRSLRAGDGMDQLHDNMMQSAGSRNAL